MWGRHLLPHTLGLFMLFLNSPHCHVASEIWAVGIISRVKGLTSSRFDSLDGKYL